MKVLGSVITKCNHNKHFDVVVHLRYRTWFLGKEKQSTVFRHKHERSANDVISFSVWYDAATGRSVSDSWCCQLDRLLWEKPDPQYVAERADALHSMEWYYHRSKPSLWYDQNFNVYVATNNLDAESLAEKLHTEKQPGFVAKISQIQEWQKIHKLKSWPNDLEGKTAREWATEYYNKQGIGLWGQVMEVDRECLTRKSL